MKSAFVVKFKVRCLFLLITLYMITLPYHIKQFRLFLPLRPLQTYPTLISLLQCLHTILVLIQTFHSQIVDNDISTNSDSPDFTLNVNGAMGDSTPED